MALPQNPYAQYRNSEILTASPGELVLKLYDGMIRYTNVAKTAIEESDVETAHASILKAERIIDHLMATLDRKYEISEEFDKIYSDLMNSLVQINLNKELELFDEVLEKMRMVRDNWRAVMRKATEDASLPLQ